MTRKDLIAFLTVVALGVHRSYAVDTVTVRMRPDISLAKLYFLADIAETKRVKLDQTETRQSFLRRTYGSSHWKIRAVFARYNRRLSEPIPRGTWLTVPAAPWWEFYITTRTTGFDDLLRQLVNITGFHGRKSRRQLIESNQDREDFCGEVELPYVALATTFELRPAWRARRRLIEHMLSGPTIMERSFDARLALVSEVSDDDDKHFPQERWPLPELTQGNSAAMSPRRDDAIVGIVDTGVPYLEGLPFRLWQNGEELDDPTADRDSNGKPGDVHGFDFAEHHGAPIDDLPMGNVKRGHGLHVAGIASGGLSDEGTRIELAQRLELMILKVAARDGSVSIRTVEEAVVYADLNGANILNLSIQGLSGSIVDRIRNTPRIFFVLAAGNGNDAQVGFDLDRERIFPYSLSRNAENAIVVGAHDPEPGRPRSRFSNYGPNSVDIIAPGRKIESLGESARLRESGTSQATPQVTLGAALIFSAGVKDARQIKHRLVASVDYDPELEDVVISSGRFNMAKAIDVANDVIELTGDKNLLRGRIASPGRIAFAVHAERSLREVLKIVKCEQNHKSSPRCQGATHRITVLENGRPQSFYDRPQITSVDVRLGDGTTQTIPFDRINDLIIHSLWQ
jgi:subtilisin family serine protease